MERTRFPYMFWAHDQSARTPHVLTQSGMPAADPAHFAGLPGIDLGHPSAAALPEAFHAVVSRGGRPDLAGDALGQVQAPTLLIVGGDDQVVLDLNRKALARLRAEKRLDVIPGATHLFEEPGALEAVVVRARDWFTRHLTRPAGR